MMTPERLRRAALSSLAVVVVLAAAGCSSAQPQRKGPAVQGSVLGTRVPAFPLPVPGPPSAPKVSTVELGRSVKGRPINATVFDGAKGCVLIIGGIHGDEPIGTAMANCLVEYLRDHPEALAGRRVVIVPSSNPDGAAAGTRDNAHGVDVNRNFSTGNFRPSTNHGRRALSEPESCAIVAAVNRYRPSCIVSIHGPLDCIDADGGWGSQVLAQRMAAVSPLSLRDLEAMQGSLGSYGGNELGLKMVTYEMPATHVPSGDSSAYLARHLPALLVAIREG
jgi:protein MpaA